MPLLTARRRLACDSVQCGFVLPSRPAACPMPAGLQGVGRRHCSGPRLRGGPGGFCFSHLHGLLPEGSWPKDCQYCQELNVIVLGRVSPAPAPACHGKHMGRRRGPAARPPVMSGLLVCHAGVIASNAAVTGQTTVARTRSAGVRRWFWDGGVSAGVPGGGARAVGVAQRDALAAPAATARSCVARCSGRASIVCPQPLANDMRGQAGDQALEGKDPA
jgi:hypothetical protein